MWMKRLKTLSSIIQKMASHDPDWIEVAPDHFVATTLKDREAYYATREEQSHEFATSK